MNLVSFFVAMLLAQFSWGMSCDQTLGSPSWQLKLGERTIQEGSTSHEVLWRVSNDILSVSEKLIPLIQSLGQGFGIPESAVIPFLNQAGISERLFAALYAKESLTVSILELADGADQMIMKVGLVKMASGDLFIRLTSHNDTPKPDSKLREDGPPLNSDWVRILTDRYFNGSSYSLSLPR